MSEQGIELGAYVTVDPLCVGLPARDSLETGRALERQGLSKSAVDD